jgi:hypothetical protein
MSSGVTSPITPKHRIVGLLSRLYGYEVQGAILKMKPKTNTYYSTTFKSMVRPLPYNK